MSKTGLIKTLGQIAKENSDDYVLEIRVKDKFTNLNRYFQDRQLHDLVSQINNLLIGKNFELTIKKEE